MVVSRRQTLRLHCDLPARWRTGSRSGRSRVLDVSAGGLLLADLVDLAAGEAVDLEIDLAGSPLALSTRVRFVGATRRGPGCGLAIVAAPGGARARWLAFYRALAERAIRSVPSSIARYLRRRTELG